MTEENQSDLTTSLNVKSVKAPQFSVSELINKNSIFVSENMNAGSGEDQPIQPPFDFSILGAIVNVSSSIRTAIEAIILNTYGAGHTFIPTVQIETIISEDEDGNEVVTTVRKDTNEEVTQEFLDDRQEQLKKATMFYKGCTVDDESYTQMSCKMGYDMEYFGNGYLEVEADATDEIRGLHHAKATLMRMFPRQSERVMSDVSIFDDFEMEWTTQERPRRFRKFRMNGKPPVFFKEFGDPRFMDSRTGKYYENLAEMPPGSEVAQEIIHMRLYDPLYTYGVPRFIPVVDLLLALRAADLLNKDFLSSSGIPAGMLIIEGYEDDTFALKLEERLEHEVKGKSAGSKIVVVQAESKAKSSGGVGPGVSAQKPSIRYEPLAPILTEDGLFGKYIEQTEARCQNVYRLASQYVGKNNDINRATAETAAFLTENQVFRPIASRYDQIQNEKILPRLNVTHWKYKTLSTFMQDPEKLVDMIVSIAGVAGLVPSEIRRFSESILGTNLSEVTGEWTKVPEYVYLQEAQEKLNEKIKEMEREQTEQQTVEKVVKSTVGDALNEQNLEAIAVKMATALLAARDGFSAKSVSVVDFDEFKKDPQKTLASLAPGYGQNR